MKIDVPVSKPEEDPTLTKSLDGGRQDRSSETKADKDETEIEDDSTSSRKVNESDNAKPDDGSANGSGGDPDEDVSMTFPQRLMEILNKDEEHGDIICWLPHGRGFMIYKKKLFETKIMPKYFHKQSKYTSFTRKLNRWGFVRVTRGPEMGAYYHKFFKRGESRLCMQMNCQRPNGLGANDVLPGSGESPTAVMAQMALQQNAAVFPTGQSYLQMQQQQHMQLLMRHREQMMLQREAMLRGGNHPSQNMAAMQQIGRIGMQPMGGFMKGNPSGAPGIVPNNAMMMNSMMGFQQN